MALVLVIGTAVVSVYLIETLPNPHKLAGRYVQHVVNVPKLLL